MYGSESFLPLIQMKPCPSSRTVSPGRPTRRLTKVPPRAARDRGLRRRLEDDDVASLQLQIQGNQQHHAGGKALVLNVTEPSCIQASRPTSTPTRARAGWCPRASLHHNLTSKSTTRDISKVIATYWPPSQIQFITHRAGSPHRLVGAAGCSTSRARPRSSALHRRRRPGRVSVIPLWRRAPRSRFSIPGDFLATLQARARSPSRRRGNSSRAPC